MLQLQNITKRYDEHVVLHIPFFEAAKGIYWIKGANGSGKTTLLKLIAGLLPFEGEIALNHISLKKQPVLYRQQIGWSEAEPLYPSFLRGKDLIKLYCNIRKAQDAEAEKLVAALRMDNYVGDAIGTYSAGMTKKLSLLLSFLGKPSLIVLDEPLITLDAETVNAAAHLIREKNQNEGTSFIISSHQDIDAETLYFEGSFILHGNTIIAG